MVAGMGLGSSPATASTCSVATIVWTGAIDANWGNPANWNTAAVPGPGDHAAWAPGGAQVAFNRGSTSHSEIWAMAADGSHQHQVTHSGGANAEPSWNSTGDRIAYSSTRRGGVQIHTVAADGSGQVQITSSAGFNGQPNWCCRTGS